MDYNSKFLKMTEKMRELDLLRPAEQLQLISTHEEIVKDLKHHKDTTVGLWAFDCDPKELIAKFVNSQSDACSLFTEDVDKLIEDWGRFCNDENKVKSPFFQIRA